MAGPELNTAVYAATAAAACGLTHLLTRGLIRVAPRLGAVDPPRPGKTHVREVPTLGGLPIVTTFLATLWALHGLGGGGLGLEQMTGLSLALALVAVLGAYDDLRGLTAWPKLTVQSVAGLVLYAHGFRIEQITNPFNDVVALGALAAPVTVFWIVAISNAINLIDGLDGLAAGVVLIGVSALSLISMRFGEIPVAVPALVLAAATAGFLPLNRPPARVFLGDTGSLSLGLAVGAISLLESRKGTVAVTLLLPIVLMSIPLLDEGLALFRRLRQGRHPFRGDTEHLHHRLLRLGLSPGQVVNLVYGVCVYLGLTAYLISVMPKQYVMLVVVILGTGMALAVITLQYLEAVGVARGAGASLPLTTTGVSNEAHGHSTSPAGPTSRA